MYASRPRAATGLGLPSNASCAASTAPPSEARRLTTSGGCSPAQLRGGVAALAALRAARHGRAVTPGQRAVVIEATAIACCAHKCCTAAPRADARTVAVDGSGGLTRACGPASSRGPPRDHLGFSGRTDGHCWQREPRAPIIAATRPRSRASDIPHGVRLAAACGADAARGAMPFAAPAAALLPRVQCRGAWLRRLDAPCVVDARAVALLKRDSWQPKLRANTQLPARLLRQPLRVVAAAAPKRAKPATTRGVQPRKGASGSSAACCSRC